MEGGGCVLSSADCTCGFVLVSFKASCKKSVLGFALMFTKKQGLPLGNFQYIFNEKWRRRAWPFCALKELL